MFPRPAGRGRGDGRRLADETVTLRPLGGRMSASLLGDLEDEECLGLGEYGC